MMRSSAGLRCWHAGSPDTSGRFRRTRLRAPCLAVADLAIRITSGAWRSVFFSACFQRRCRCDLALRDDAILVRCTNCRVLDRDDVANEFSLR